MERESHMAPLEGRMAALLGQGLAIEGYLLEE